jgi:hypothetical protein
MQRLIANAAQAGIKVDEDSNGTGRVKNEPGLSEKGDEHIQEETNGGDRVAPSATDESTESGDPTDTGKQWDSSVGLQQHNAFAMGGYGFDGSADFTQMGWNGQTGMNPMMTGMNNWGAYGGMNGNLET